MTCFLLLISFAKFQGHPPWKTTLQKLAPKTNRTFNRTFQTSSLESPLLSFPQTTMTKKTFLSWVECRYARQFLQIGLDDQNSDIIALAGKNRQQT